jgi:hypothetical protein
VEANEGQRQWWNDERSVEMWPKRERLTDAVTAFLLDAAALQPGERVLDVGSGGVTQEREQAPLLASSHIHDADPPQQRRLQPGPLLWRLAARPRRAGLSRT